MIAKNQNSFHKNNFRQELWSEVSASCNGGAWCYSTSEKRLFYLLFGVTAILGIVYFSGFTNEVAIIFKSSKQLAKLNDSKLQTMQSQVSITATPQASVDSLDQN